MLLKLKNYFKTASYDSDLVGCIVKPLLVNLIVVNLP